MRKWNDRIFPVFICVFFSWSLYQTYQEDGIKGVAIILAGGLLIFVAVFVVIMGLIERAMRKEVRK